MQMLQAIHSKKSLQLFIGLVIGIAFGFLLQKGGATRYDVIIGQLLLKDFTVVKIMLSAVITGMIGLHILKGLGLARMHIKAGSLQRQALLAKVFSMRFLEG
jgi:Na+/H+-dicarboxylate symporter